MQAEWSRPIALQRGIRNANGVQQTFAFPTTIVDKHVESAIISYSGPGFDSLQLHEDN
jgi:hypothetical protein